MKSDGPGNPFRSVSVVIRAYNEERGLGRLMDGLQAQTCREVEVVLVDSGSSDRTVSIAEGYGARIVRIHPQDFSFGYSLNRGIEACTHGQVVIASAHVYPVYPDWLERLLEPFADPRVALTYGKQRGDQHSQYSEVQVFRQWYPDREAPRQAHPFCNNANAAIRKDLWTNTRYDETLPGLEDLDWAERIMRQGYLVRYVPEAEIVHLHRETPQGIYRRYLREGMAFKRIFPQEDFSLRDLARLTTSNILADWRAAAREKALGQHWRDIIWFRAMQFLGTYRGYRRPGPLTWQLKQRFYYPHLPPANSPGSPARSVEPIRYNKDAQGDR